MMVPVRKALAEAGLSKADIDDVVLVGGSTWIPKVRQLLEGYFRGKAPTPTRPSRTAPPSTEPSSAATTSSRRRENPMLFFPKETAPDHGVFLTCCVGTNKMRDVPAQIGIYKLKIEIQFCYIVSG